MRRFSFIWYIVMMLTLPLAIVLLSGNIVLRIPETYVYHFNDSQVTNEVGNYVSGQEFADSITKYFNSLSREKFQVYETNGEYRDPIFDETESQAMYRAKNAMTWTLIAGVILMIVGLAIYIYLYRQIPRIVLRRLGFIAGAVAFVEMLVEIFLVHRPNFRASIYNRFIETELSKESTLNILLQSPFEKTYVIFAFILSIVITGILVYIHQYITREKRLFS